MKTHAYLLPIMGLCLAFFACNIHPDEPDTLPDTNDSTLINDTIPSNDSTTQTPTSDTQHNPQYLYDIAALPHITLEITENDWNQYLANFDRNPHNEDYVPAAFTFVKGKDTFHRDSVGVRPRGNTSRRRPEGNTGEKHQKNNPNWHHAHFGIRFDKYDSGEPFFGSDRVYLKWFKDDAAYVREVYCYDLFHRFGVWSAPRASYCRLTIHIIGDPKPAYFGVYALIEGVNDGYLKDRQQDGYFPDRKGNLWKASYGANLSDANKSNMGVSDPEVKEYIYDLKTNKKKGLEAAKTELADFIEGMRPLKSGSAELQQWLEQHIDIDLFLRAQAVNVMVGMWDDYWHNQNNYYFYFDLNHRFYFIPYDYDNSLGTSQDINSGTQDPLHWGSREGDRLLMRKVLSIKQFEDQYITYLHELAATDFSYNASRARIQAWQKMIQPYIANDTGEDMVIADQPASWGNCSFYRLLSGNDKGGQQGDANFFLTKIASLPKQ